MTNRMYIVTIAIGCHTAGVVSINKQTTVTKTRNGQLQICVSENNMNNCTSIQTYKWIEKTV